MRKIVYSGVVKFIAVILFVASIVCGVLIAADGIFEYFNEDENIYSFGSDFSEWSHITFLLNRAENIVLDAYDDVLYVYDETRGMYVIKSDIDSEEIRIDLTNKIKEKFENYHSDEINYYVQYNDLLITNCGAENAEELMQGEYYSYFKRDSAGQIKRRSSVERDTYTYLLEEMGLYDNTSTIIIGCNIKEEVVKEYKAIWEKQESIVINTFVQTLVCAIVALIVFIYLLCVCGKNKNGEYKNMWLDNIWIEVHLGAIAGFGIGALELCIFVTEEYMHGRFPHNLIYLAMGTASALGSLVILTSLLSIIRNIKTRRLIETSITLRVLRWIIRLFVKVVKWILKQTKVFWTTLFRLFSKKTGVIFISMLLVYTALIGILAIGSVVSPVWLIVGVLLFGFACFLVAYRAKDFDEIKKGISEVRNGNVAYKIPELKCDDMRTLAVNVNDIAEGLDKSVSAKLKAERLKNELITNVSHDLKTPITSIISYTELLSKIEDLSEEAKDYVAVIAKKSDRLKRLTQDLFDISKVQSGNDEVVLEKLDAALLINQALGEHDNEIQSSGLPFCVKAPKELYILADGRKMSRVLSNLINNILKYAMKNTRVFITASEKDGNIEMEFKNISAYPLNFNVEEITQRFVRGDESRTAEGNGLGLAIAKSYTEICNGTFEVAVDGDMFKAILKFRKL